MDDKFVNFTIQLSAHRLLSASARAPPGNWLYPPDSKSPPDKGIKWNLVAKEYTVLDSNVMG